MLFGALLNEDCCAGCGPNGQVAKFSNHHCSTHQNPLVRQIGEYTMSDLQQQYKRYIHKRTKHLLL